MKILLFAVNGSYTHTNLAIRALRRPLEQAGFEVTLLERNLRENETHLFQDLVSQKADIVGFSTYIWNVSLMLSLAQDLRKIRPGVRIFFGGPEVSYDTERFEKVPFIDAIFCGEGEETLPRLCLDYQADPSLFEGQLTPRIIPAPPSSSVMRGEGILYRENDFPAGSIIYYESSRGCPYECAYCLSSVTGGIRYKSVEQTLADLEAFEALPEKIRIIKFVDRTFNFSPRRANAIWEALLSDRFTRHYHFELCASLLNEESFDILSRFPKGKIQLEFGLQSTCPQTLAAVSRHIDPSQVLDAVSRIHDSGRIHVHLDLIAGLPFEGYERFARSFDEAYFCCDQLQLGFLKLLHGTELRRRAEEYGMVYRTEAPYTVLQTKWMSFEELSRLSRIAELLERYHDSGHFASCLDYLLRYVPSPFRFYEGFDAFLGTMRIRNLSQANAYQVLFDYVCQLFPSENLTEPGKTGLDEPNANPFDLNEFVHRMHEDYSSFEVKKAPVFLRSGESDLKRNTGKPQPDRKQNSKQM